MQKTEQNLREKLAATHHILHFQNHDDLISTHLSARIPDSDHMLITPHNIPFEEVSASKIVKTDLDGNIMGDSEFKAMPQATNIHASVYKKSKAIQSAMHTHSIYGTAVASLKCGLLFTNQHVLRFYENVAYHDYDALALDNEGEQIANSLGNNQVMILKNHGLLTTGSSIEEAYYFLHYLERACEIQIKTLAAGTDIQEIPKDVCEKTRQQFDTERTPEIAFEVMLKRIEGKSNINYRS